ncbi:MAG: PIN domain-containing protein [Candidatus Micrarchaeia archaeon]
MIVVLDSNFLLVPFEFKVDVFDQARGLLAGKLDFVVLDSCISEIKSFEGQTGRKMLSALNALEKKGLTLVKGTGKARADDDIVAFASSNDVVVCSNDSLLRKRLKEKGVKTIFLRKKSFLVLE